MSDTPESEQHRLTADVKITKRGNQPASVVINGEEMNMQILSGSLSVTFPQPDEDPYRDAYVTFTLAANVEMDIDSEVTVDRVPAGLVRSLDDLYQLRPDLDPKGDQ